MTPEKARNHLLKLRDDLKKITNFCINNFRHLEVIEDIAAIITYIEEPFSTVSERQTRKWQIYDQELKTHLCQIMN